MTMSWSNLVMYGVTVDGITATLGSRSALVSLEADGWRLCSLILI